MTIGITGKFVQLNGQTYPLLDLSSIDPATAGGAANTLATNSGAAVSFAQLSNAFVASGAAIDIAKLAHGSANTLFTSDGSTNTFAQLTNAFVSPSAAIDITKLAHGSANTLFTSDGSTNTFAQLTNAFVSPSAAIDITKLAHGSANTLFTSDGSTNTFAQLTNAFVSPSAAIDITKLAHGSANTLFTSDGSTNTFAQLTNPFVSASAAIGGTKINPDFGSQNVFTLGIVAAGTNSASIGALTETAGAVVSVGAYNASYQFSNTTTALATHTARRAGGTRASPTAVANTWSVGEYRFSAYDGANFITGARTYAEVDGAVSSGVVPMRWVAQTGSSLATQTDRISISSAGVSTIAGPIAFGSATNRSTTGELRAGYGLTLLKVRTQDGLSDRIGFSFGDQGSAPVVNNVWQFGDGSTGAQGTTTFLEGGVTVAMRLAGTGAVTVTGTGSTGSISFNNRTLRPGDGASGTTAAMKPPPLNQAGVRAQNFQVSGADNGSATGTAGYLILTAGAANAQTLGTGNFADVMIAGGVVAGGGVIEGNIAFHVTSVPTWQGLTRGFYVGDRRSAPTGAPANGYFNWSESGVPTFLTSGNHKTGLDGTMAATANLGAGVLPATPQDFYTLVTDNGTRKVACYLV